MIATIFLKWGMQGIDSIYNANLITAMINLFLGYGTVDSTTQVMVNANTQTTIERCLLTVGLICVPVMLLVKPIVMSKRAPAKQININPIFPLLKEDHGHSFGELFVHQMIETIE